MATPYLVSQVGVLPTALIMLVAYLISLVLHIMLAELSTRTEYSSELLTIFSKHLFHDKRAFQISFYVLVAATLVCLLAVYITGAGEILADLLGLPFVLTAIFFFVLAALVVFFGLKRVAINEVVAVGVMLTLLVILAVSSILLPEHQPLPPSHWEASPLLAVYGIIMVSLSSLFSVPQAAAGLCCNTTRLRNCVAIGILINLLVTATIVICVLICSNPVTEVAIIGWAKALGGYTQTFGSLFIILAMLTSFWSLSLQLSDMTKRLFKVGRIPSWLAATTPSFLIALLPLSGFLGLIRIAGGAIAIIVAVMAVPAYRNAVKGADGSLLGRLGKSRILYGILFIMYLLMAISTFL